MTEPSEASQASLTLKVLLLLVMFVLTLVGGLLPIPLLKLLRRKSKKRRTVSEQSTGSGLVSDSKWPSLALCLLTCFSGGVFLATCFLDLLPNAVSKFEEIKEKRDWHIDYPIAELLMCVGFFIVFFAEEIVLFCFGMKGHSHGTMDLDNGGRGGVEVRRNGVVHVHDHRQRRVTQDNGEAYENPSLKETHNVKSNGIIINPSGNQLENYEPVGSLKERIARDLANENLSKPRGDSLHLCDDRECLTTNARSDGAACSSSTNPVVLLDVNPLYDPMRQDEDVGTSQDCIVYTNTELAEPERCEGPCYGDKDPPILMTSRPHAHSHGIRSFTLVLALSFHMIFEGMAFGIQNSRADLIMLFISLSIHKAIVFFAVGLQLARTHAHRLTLVVGSILLLALVTPIGGGIGITVSEASINSNSKAMTLMIFDGLATGTFLYVTFFEILIHERDNEHPNLLKLVVIVLGFALMAGLQVLDKDSASPPVTTISPQTFNTTIMPYR